MTIDPHLLEQTKRETLARISATREQLTSQLHAAAWAVHEACDHAQGGELPEALAAAERAKGLVFAATGTEEPIRGLVALIGGVA
jgi:hypothetical protein